MSSPTSPPEMVALVRFPAVLTTGVGVIAVIIGTITEGSRGLLAAVLGAAVVIAFFAIGQIIVGRVLRNNPALALNVALLVYVVQIGALFVLLIVLREATFFAPRVFAFTVLACALTWTLGSVIGFTRTRSLYVEPGSGPGGDLQSK